MHRLNSMKFLAAIGTDGGLAAAHYAGEGRDDVPTLSVDVPEANLRVTVYMPRGLPETAEDVRRLQWFIRGRAMHHLGLTDEWVMSPPRRG